MSSASGPHDIDRFFRGLTEHAFHARLGVVDPSLVDYVAFLLVRFLRSDRIAAWPRDLRGRKLPLALEAVGLVGAAGSEAADDLPKESPPGREDFRDVGDTVLFWTGLYPEAIHGEAGIGRATATRSSTIDYRSVGKKAYLIASTLPAEGGNDDAELLERLSHEFDLCVEGLGEVRRAWGR
jgi:hypothetical protein